MMPFYRVAISPERSLDEASLARHLSSAAHPSSQVRSSLLLDIQTPYMPLVAPGGAEWPRATIRPLPLIGRAGCSWAAKIWLAQGVPAKEKGRWITKTDLDLGLVMDWAVAEVKSRRPKDHSAGPWGSAC